MEIIELTRGDTCLKKFQRKDQNGDPIHIRAREIFFTVKKAFTSQNYLFQKTLDDMTFDEAYYYHITIEPEDTNGLAYGDYAFDIEVKELNYTQTIAKGILRVTEESTWAVNE